MRKGDLRRQAILDAAERLFYERGYERTSVQDILDALSMSKGGFYHHFESKLSVLEALCRQRGESGYQRCEALVLASRGTAVDKLNLLLEQGFFFGQDSMDFVGLMVRVVYRDGCVQLRDALQNAQLRQYLGLATRIIHEGIRAKLFYHPNPNAVARILLMMNNCMTDEVARAIVRIDDESAAMEALDLIGAYRASVELLLNAPYGSVRLIELERVAAIMRKLAAP